MSELSPIVLAALADLAGKKAKGNRDKLGVGEHDFEAEVTLKLSGSVNVLEDESYTPTVKIPHKLAMALFLRYAGVTGPAAMDALVRAMTEALRVEAEIEGLKGKAKKAAMDAIREVADLDAAEAAVVKGLAELPKESRRGKVIVSASMEVVSGDAVFSDAPADAGSEEKVG